MMNRIDQLFATLRRQHRKALIAFLMAGDPSVAATRRLVRLLTAHGVDLIELGSPFSDPLADGPTIQRASQRALRQGMSLERVLTLVRAIRRESAIPLVLLSYWNPLLQYGGRRGLDRFVRDAKRAGVDGVVVPDLPIEEARSLTGPARRAGLATVFLAAPTSPPRRLRAVAKHATGFIYYVSVTGTTGARRKLPATLTAELTRLKRLTRKPVCVGFGVSTPLAAARIARVADGVIVGSALINLVERHPRNFTGPISRWIQALRRAVG